MFRSGFTHADDDDDDDNSNNTVKHLVCYIYRSSKKQAL